MNIYTCTIKDRDRYEKFLKIMSPIRILRCLSKVDEKEKSGVEIASYPQSMALMCSYGSIGWLLIFSSILTLKGFFFIIIGIPLLIALKTICRAFSKEEAKNIGAYSAFLVLLIFYILIICIVFFNPIELHDAPESFSAIHMFLIGLCFLLMGSAYYLNSVQKAINYLFPYLFSWDDVPGNDCRRLLKFLDRDLKIEGLENAEITKSNDGKAITVKNDKNLLTFKLNEEENKVNLETSGGEVHEYISKEENGKRNIYPFPNEQHESC